MNTENTNSNPKTLHSPLDTGEVIYVPQEIIQAFNSIFNKMKRSQQKFISVAEAMRSEQL